MSNVMILSKVIFHSQLMPIFYESIKGCRPMYATF